MMIKIEKARFKHFEAVYKLLLKLEGPYNTKSDWKNLFFDHFHSGETHFGYILLDNDVIVGFLGLIYSKRKVDDHKITFCNIGNWIVLPEYRNKSINLLIPVLKLDDCVLTNFTASKTVSTILKTLKFKELGDNIIIILPLPDLAILKLFNKKIEIVYDNQIKKFLSIDEMRIFNDHSCPDFKCKNILLKDARGTCYIVAKRAYRKSIPFLHIHYLSNAEIFAEYVDIFRMIVPFKFKVAGIIVYKRFLKGKKIKYVINYKLQSPRYYKSTLKNSFSDLSNIDHLYSEFMVLHI